MIVSNPKFNSASANLTLWRYMDIYKFLDLIYNKRLFFCRADKFMDHYDSEIPLKSIIEKYNRFNKKDTFVNCWNINLEDSDLLWNKYVERKFSVAIRSSIELLNESFTDIQEVIFSSKVIYVNDNEDNLNKYIVPDGFGGKAISALIFKRDRFKEENEFRLIYNHSYWEQSIEDHGKFFMIDINKLFDKIVLSPYCEDWHIKLVEEVLEKEQIKKEVIKSTIYME